MITYNNKDILKSFIGNNRVIKKYLNNKVVYGTPDFAQYYNIQGYDNYEVVGSPTIVDGIVSGFSESNYLKTDSGFSITENTKLDIGFKITGATTGQTSEDIMYAITSGGGSLRFYLATNGKVRGLWSGADGTTKYINVALTYNNDVNFRFLRDGNDITFLVQDNNEWITLFTSDAGMRNMNITQIRLGGGNSTSYFIPLDGSIDLNKTYIKVNGKYWFNGNPNYKELLDCNPNVYLQNNSNWNAYIDTGIIPSKDVKFEISAQLVDTTIKDGALFGCRKSSATTTSNFLLWYNNLIAGYGAFNYGRAYENNWSPGIYDPYQKQTCLYNGNGVYINDVLQTSGYTANKSAFNTDLTIYLFGYRYDNTLQTRTFRGRVYNFKFRDGDTLIQHLVPVPEGLQIGSYKVPSNGMFDIVTQTFYENKGSGEFIWGVDL